MIQSGLLKILHLPDYCHWSGLTQVEPIRTGDTLAETIGREMASSVVISPKDDNVKLERSLKNDASTEGSKT